MDELAALVEQVPDEILDYIEDLETRVEKAEAFIASLDDPASEPTDIEKALTELPPAMAEFVKSQSERLAEAEKALEAERLAKANAEWTQKLRSIDGLVDNPGDLGSKLQKVAEGDPELADSILSTLQAANARLAKSDLFAELGHGVPAGTDTALGKVQAIAKAITEAHPTKTAAEAEAEAWEANPDLYDQYVAERREALK
jgi:hypothetical protein